VRLASLSAYILLLWIGLPCFSPTVWRALLPSHSSQAVAPHVAAASLPAWFGLCVVYLVESIFASVGWVSLHSWKPREVIVHHLSVVAGSAAIVCTFIASPAQFLDFVEEHPPMVAITGASIFTCFNEAFFVLRSLLPPVLADAPQTCRASSAITLTVLLVQIPLHLVACTRSCYLIATGAHAGFAAWKRASIATNMVACIGFVLIVQMSYLRPNLRRVLGWSRNKQG